MRPIRSDRLRRTMRPLNLAIIGTRGIPANYGGFETFAQELSTRLVRRGHRVTVYCRSHYCRWPERQFQGVDLTVLPAIRHKYLDTLSHTFLSTLHLLFKPFDAILVCNAANAIFCLLPRLAGKRVILNVDGIERKRKKWNALGRWYYDFSERIACLAPHVTVTDAICIQDYYRTRHRRETVMIPYGATPFAQPPGPVLQQLGVEPGSYFLYVSRLEPENNAALVIRIFEQVQTTRPLLIVGDAPYGRDYIHSLRQTKDPRIVFPGAIYGGGYRELVSNACCYVHATEVGGTHPALIENMAAGNLILYLDTPENREVTGGTGLPFSGAQIPEAVRLFQSVAENPASFQELRQRARERAAACFSWEAVTASYLQLFSPRG